jgi:uncharacterized protein (TIGR00156 family)
MQYIPFISRGKGTVPALFFMLSVFLLVLALSAGAAYAKKGKHEGWSPEAGGYTGPGPALVSVRQALSMPHDAGVSVKGNITQYLGKNDYTFADSTGSAEVKIPPHAWMGQSVPASDAVELQGVVKKKLWRTRIHVHRIVAR